MDVRPVVVGIDGSTTSREALVWAAHEARLRGVPLRVVHARFRPTYDPIFAGGFYLPPIALEGEGTDVALGAAADVVRRVDPDLPVETSVCLGAAASVLLDEAEAGAGLVVVGSRGLGAFDALFLGSVSTHLAAHSPSPVVVVPPGTKFSADGPVVVGVDGTPHSDEAVRAAAREAATRGVPLDLVTAFLVPTDTLVTPLSAGPGALGSACRQDAHDLVEAAAQGVRRVDADLDVRVHVAEGSPAEVVARVAGSTASLVVVGSRGRGAVRGPVLGSVSQSVLHHAAWPVMVVRAARDGR